MAIVGGMFGLPEVRDGGSMPPFMRGEHLLLMNARSGIALLVRTLAPRRVWVPSYLCHTMLSGIDADRTEVRFYEVNYDLRLVSSEWTDEVGQGDLVVFIDYFGWPCDADCISKVRTRGAWVLEDACQAMLSENLGTASDFILFSPRKFLGIPDGGVLVCNCSTDALDHIELLSPPPKWWLKALSAVMLRREFDNNGGSRHWYELYGEVEAGNLTGPFRMSDLSRTLLMHAFDYEAIAGRRRGNYLTLASQLEDIAFFPELPTGVVPLGFPVRLKNRDEVRQTLFGHEVYPPVHWPISGVVPEHFRESHALAADIMMVPCDQRYDDSEMYRVAALVREELAR